MLWRCDLCDLELEVPDGHVVRCQHSAIEVPVTPRPARVCVHYDTELNPIRLECGCGFVTKCKLLNKLCSYTTVIDEFVFAKEVPEDLIQIKDLSTRRGSDLQLTSDNFQSCGSCKFKDEQPEEGFITKQ